MVFWRAWLYYSELELKLTGNFSDKVTLISKPANLSKLKLVMEVYQFQQNLQLEKFLGSRVLFLVKSRIRHCSPVLGFGRHKFEFLIIYLSKSGSAAGEETAIKAHRPTVRELS